MTGEITVVRKPCGNDPALDQVAEYLEACTAHLPDTTIERGFTVSDDAPGPANTNLPWLKTTECGQVWMHWNAKCGQWTTVNGIPGERQTRRRVADTVAEEMSEHFSSWQLADGSNLLGIDLRQLQPLTSVFRLNFLPVPEEEVAP